MEQAISLNKRILLTASQFLILLSVVSFAPLLNNQFVTGTIVNASLLVSVVLLGMSGSLLLCLLPSLISLVVGLLPIVMVPMVPFIVLGNIIFILTFNALRKRNYFFGLVPAALLKFSFLFLTSNFLIQFFIKQAVASKIAVMMSWPQLVTALSGGFIAYLIIVSYNSFGNNK